MDNFILLLAVCFISLIECGIHYWCFEFQHHSRPATASTMASQRGTNSIAISSKPSVPSGVRLVSAERRVATRNETEKLLVKNANKREERKVRQINLIKYTSADINCLGRAFTTANDLRV